MSGFNTSLLHDGVDDYPNGATLVPIYQSSAFGVMIEEEGMAYRGTFLVNPEGKIKIAEIQDNNIGRNADELLRKVEAAQFVATHDGEVCPAKWKKGAETLKPSIDLVGKI